ncbi:MAG TPA: glycosyltransferase, partial [Bacteroidia bacterium]
NAINVDYIKRFNECWIPDHPELRLSGSLSGNKIISAAKYIGLLSRFSKHKKAGDEKFDVLLLLSGVEPQRTILEEKLINYFQNTNHSVALVRGTKEQMTTLPSHITPFGLLCSEELKELIGQSNTVICRSGYSSIMDLVMLQKKMFLVPTPGQPEQEYLAEYLHQKYGIPYMEQQAIAKQVFALDSSKAIELPFGIKNENLLEGAIAKLPK